VSNHLISKPISAELFFSIPEPAKSLITCYSYSKILHRYIPFTFAFMKLKVLLFVLLLLPTYLFAQTSIRIAANGEALNPTTIKTLMQKRGYDAVSAFDTISYEPLRIYAIYIKKNKWGILDNQGKEICPPLYDDIDGLNRDYNTMMGGIHKNFTVKQNKKYGLLSQDGKLLIPAMYDYIEYKDSIVPYSQHRADYDQIDSVYLATIGKKTTVYNRAGKAIAAMPSDIDYTAEVSVSAVSDMDEFGPYSSSFSENDILYSGKKRFHSTENKKTFYGVKDSDKVIIPAIYSYINEDRYHRFIVQQNGKYGLIDSLNQNILPIEYDAVEEFNGSYFVTKNQKIALYDKALQPLSDFIYGTRHYGNQYLLLLSKDEKMGLVNYEGKALSEFIYDHIELITNCNNFEETPLVRVTQGNRKGLLSYTGKRLTDMVYDDIIPECTVETESYALSVPFNMIANTVNQFYFFKQDGKYGIMDTNLHVTHQAEYDMMIKSMLDTIVYVAKYNANHHLIWGLLNTNTQTLSTPLLYETPPKYRRGGFFHHNQYVSGGFFMSSLHGKYGLIDDQGKVIVPFEWPQEIYVNLVYNGLLRIESFSPKAFFYVDYLGHNTK
jgi:hypothetical protein